MSSSPLRFFELVACFAMAGCFGAGSVSESKFQEKHPDCDEVDTIKDATGRVHVRGCGYVEIYDCSVESTGSGYRYEQTYETSGQLYTQYGSPYVPSTSPGASAPAYKRVSTFSSRTVCKEMGEGEKRSPDVQAWLLARRPQAAPPAARNQPFSNSS